MTAHAPHRDDRPEVLVDGCPRCAEHAAEPLLSLDPDRVGRLWMEMVAVEKTGELDRYLSRLDAQACKQLYRVAVWVERSMPALDPWRWPWGMRLTIPGGTLPRDVGEQPFGGYEMGDV